MRNAETIAGVIAERGTHDLPLERINRLLFNRDLYRHEYGRLSRNDATMDLTRFGGSCTLLVMTS